MCTIGERIRSCRRTANMSLDDLSSLIGVSSMTLSKYERDKHVPEDDIVELIAKHTGCREDYIKGKPLEIKVTLTRLLNVDWQCSCGLD